MSLIVYDLMVLVEYDEEGSHEPDREQKVVGAVVKWWAKLQPQTSRPGQIWKHGSLLERRSETITKVSLGDGGMTIENGR